MRWSILSCSLALFACTAEADMDKAPYWQSQLLVNGVAYDGAIWTFEFYTEATCSQIEGAPELCYNLEIATNRLEVARSDGMGLVEADFDVALEVAGAICQKAGLGGRGGDPARYWLEDGKWGFMMDCMSLPSN